MCRRSSSSVRAAWALALMASVVGCRNPVVGDSPPAVLLGLPVDNTFVPLDSGARVPIVPDAQSQQCYVRLAIRVRGIDPDSVRTDFLFSSAGTPLDADPVHFFGALKASPSSPGWLEDLAFFIYFPIVSEVVDGRPIHIEASIKDAGGRSARATFDGTIEVLNATPGSPCSPPPLFPRD